MFERLEAWYGEAQKTLPRGMRLGLVEGFGGRGHGTGQEAMPPAGFRTVLGGRLESNGVECGEKIVKWGRQNDLRALSVGTCHPPRQCDSSRVNRKVAPRGSSTQISLRRLRSCRVCSLFTGGRCSNNNAIRNKSVKKPNLRWKKRR